MLAEQNIELSADFDDNISWVPNNKDLPGHSA